ncbi:MAG TPA: SMP-30/gluconolactonase/LRE family protein [Thermoanaerobaculia bacterium]|nr:SMP-30/gluconolactonase/LRE family protein [Thermoanaerobaculia bacterium]
MTATLPPASRLLSLLASLLLSLGAGAPLLAAGPGDPPEGAPAAALDLATSDGAAAAKAVWRYADAKIVETDFRLAGPDGQPGDVRAKTYDLEPHAGAADFDDASWETLPPGELAKRRGAGRLSFAWYRVRVTLPEAVGSVSVRGATIVFETSIDDYAEVWVDGELPRRAGQSGGSVVAGWNGVNRVVIARNAQPGRTVTLAVLGANGPLSNPPTNYIWMRLARLLFYTGPSDEPFALVPEEVNVEVLRKDPGVDAIVPQNAKIWRVADNFTFTEGPVWDARTSSLLFSDPNRNRIYRYTPDVGSGAGRLDVFREKSGYAGADVAEYGQPGSNGLTFDREGRLTFDQHGNHAVVRLEKDGRLVTLADRYEGKRLNSPNDLAVRSNGDVYFTDPPFGLPKFFDDPRKELPFSGVFGILKGRLTLLATDFAGPNGIAFTPDEKFLYVANWDERKKVIFRYPVKADGTLGKGTLFHDLTPAKGEDALDGMKVDVKGNLYVSGPGGLFILSPEGRHLGTIVAPKHPHNFAWGDADGRTLYLCARSSLYRIRLNVPGVRP